MGSAELSCEGKKSTEGVRWNNRVERYLSGSRAGRTFPLCWLLLALSQNKAHIRSEFK